MKNKHPLVCCFGQLGDMIMLTPLLKRLNDRSGLSCDIVAIGEWNQALFDSMPYVNNIHTVEPVNTPYLFNKSQKSLVKFLKKSNYENVWICDSNKKIIWLLNKGGVTPDKSISSYAVPRLINEHIVSHWQRLADMTPDHCNYPLLNSKQAENTELFVTDYETDVCKNWLRTRGINHKAPLVCIQSGNKRATRVGGKKRSHSSKYWPRANWAKTIDSILTTMPDAQILLCGTPSQQSHTLEIKALCNHQSNIYSVASELPLRRLITLLSISHSCISVNADPAHVAAAVNCPLTALVGKTDARVFSPKSSESNVILVAGRNDEIDLKDGEAAWKTAHDMNLITVDAVIDGWKKSFS